MDYKQWRIDRGLTQAQAGERIGASKSTWGRIERGQEVAEVYRLAAAALTATATPQEAPPAPAEEAKPATLPEPPKEPGYLPPRFESAPVVDAATLEPQPDPEADPDTVTVGALPVARRTEYLTLRQHKRRQVMTFIDIADAYQVPVSSVHRAFYSNRSRWGSGPSLSDAECSMEPVQTAGGLRSIMLFTLKGASRFAFHLRSGRAEAVQDHCLELLMAEARGEGLPVPTSPGLTDLARLVGLRTAEIESAIQQQQAQIAEVRAAVKQTADLARAAAQDEMRRQIEAQEHGKRLLDAKRRYIRKAVEQIADHLCKTTPAAVDRAGERTRRAAIFRNVWGSVHLYACVSKFDDILTQRQADAAMGGLGQIAKAHGAILPAFQPPFDLGGEVAV